ncbi:replication protein A 14 kDa subunit B [Momordica charantia]|uniref:Replication protein A 14 kDa subunit B n=1 Tax=Momordica charantia TaxID=3673 RepID=A0A6J1CTX6_MOMCH|nr:replication protein A 14 kDa subunit B [Momordica charantia]
MKEDDLSLDLFIKLPLFSTHPTRNFNFAAFKNPRSFSSLSLAVRSNSFHFPRSLQSLNRMDTSNPSVFVNAELLRLYVGRRVRAVIQVQSEGNGVIYGKSTDDNQIIVKGSPPFSLSKFVEVIGIADTDKSIRPDVWTNFGDSFDTSTFNQLCQLANGEFKPLFI